MANNNNGLTLRDLEEMVQRALANHDTIPHEFCEQYSLLVTIKQARALEFIEKNLRDLVQRNSRIS